MIGNSRPNAEQKGVRQASGTYLKLITPTGIKTAALATTSCTIFARYLEMPTQKCSLGERCSSDLQWHRRRRSMSSLVSTTIDVVAGVCTSRRAVQGWVGQERT